MILLLLLLVILRHFTVQGENTNTVFIINAIIGGTDGTRKRNIPNTLVQK